MHLFDVHVLPRVEPPPGGGDPPEAHRERRAGLRDCSHTHSRRPLHIVVDMAGARASCDQRFAGQMVAQGRLPTGGDLIAPAPGLHACRHGVERALEGARCSEPEHPEGQARFDRDRPVSLQISAPGTEKEQARVGSVAPLHRRRCEVRRSEDHDTEGQGVARMRSQHRSLESQAVDPP